MLEKVFYTSVLVRDQDKALDFYTNVLGLEKRVENPTPDGPRFLTVGVQGDEFQLVLWPGTPGQAEPAMGRPPASITIETDDLPEDGRGAEVARRRVHLGRARVPLGLRRAVPGPRRQPAPDPRGPLRLPTVRARRAPEGARRRRARRPRALARPRGSAAPWHPASRRVIACDAPGISIVRRAPACSAMKCCSRRGRCGRSRLSGTMTALPSTATARPRARASASCVAGVGSSPSAPPVHTATSWQNTSWKRSGVT